MTCTIRLPRLLDHAVSNSLVQHVEGTTIEQVLHNLFEKEPGLRSHLVDGDGEIRPHVSLFVDGSRADARTPVPEGASIRVLHAVSGG